MLDEGGGRHELSFDAYQYPKIQKGQTEYHLSGAQSFMRAFNPRVGDLMEIYMTNSREVVIKCSRSSPSTAVGNAPSQATAGLQSVIGQGLSPANRCVQKKTSGSLVLSSHVQVFFL